jgi:leucyl-tRNA synthetase
MVFAGPPEDDIDWADVSPSGSVKFLARAFRIAAEVTSAPGADPAGGDAELRKVTHRTIDEVTRLVEAHRYNVAVARMMELTSAARRVIDTGAGAGDPAVREAAETLAVTLSLFSPYTAEEMWERLGHAAPVATAGWPAADPALLVQESVTCVVQVAGKVRDRLEVAPDIAAAELERLALESEKVRAALGEHGIRKVIVRAPKIVNIVPA